MDINEVSLTKYDRRIIHYYELILYYKYGGFSIYTIINYLLILISIIVDILVITGNYSVNILSSIILLCANIFIYLKGPFLFINRNVAYRIKNRIKTSYNLSNFEARKFSCVFHSCKKQQKGDLFDLKVNISGAEYIFTVHKEISQRTKYLNLDDYIEVFLLKNINENDEKYLVIEVLDYKRYFQTYKKISRRNPQTNEKITKEKHFF